MPTFTREQLTRYTVDRLRLRKYGPSLLIDAHGKIYAKGPPWYKISDQTAWRTLIVQAASARHARHKALEAAEAWGGWGDQ